MNIMLDLETLDTAPTALIAAIGAVRFDRTGVFCDPFYETVNLQSGIDAGCTISGDTILWWMAQSAEARASTFTGVAAPLRDALVNFARWADRTPDVPVWGNGPGFDNVILANAYRAVGLNAPWKFWNDRCYRTATSTHPRKSDPKRAHNALYDAGDQARHLIEVCPDLI